MNNVWLVKSSTTTTSFCLTLTFFWRIEAKWARGAREVVKVQRGRPTFWVAFMFGVLIITFLRYNHYSYSLLFDNSSFLFVFSAFSRSPRGTRRNKVAERWWGLERSNKLRALTPPSSARSRQSSGMLRSSSSPNLRNRVSAVLLSPLCWERAFLSVLYEDINFLWRIRFMQHFMLMPLRRPCASWSGMWRGKRERKAGRKVSILIPMNSR